MSSLSSIMAASRRRFDPLSLSPALWLDASDADTLYDATSGGSLVAPNGLVRRWEDKSRNEKHGISEGTAPVRKTGVQNSRDIIRWSANGGFLTSLSYLIDNVDIFAVWNKTGNPSNIFGNISAIVGGSALGGFGGRWNIGTTDAGARRVQVRSNSGVFSITYYTDATLPTAAELWRFRGDSTTISGSRNGAALTDALHGLTPATTPGNFKIGRGDLTGGSDFSIRADVMEILIFSSHLTSGDVAKVQAYLNNKWAIY
jgi:hypothetical protein